MKSMRAKFAWGVALAFGVVLPGRAFDVAWNCRQLAVHPVRVSAFPMNRVWFGHQRPVEQSVVSGFVSFDLASAGELVIRPDDRERMGEPVVLPLSWKPQMSWADGVLRLKVDGPRQFVVSFGRDAPVLHVFANPPFEPPRGARVRTFGPGEHDVGTLCPQSGETVVIEDGAVVHGSILIAHADGVRITGRGIVDASLVDRTTGDSVQNRAGLAAGLAPAAFGEEYACSAFVCAWSTNVTVEGVVFRDSPMWTMNVRSSRSVTVDNVKVFGWRYNSDGFSASTSEDVTIRNSFIRSFDDCLVPHGCGTDPTEREAPLRNFLAENCVLWCDWGVCLRACALHRPALLENVRFRDIAVVQADGSAPICDVTTFYGSSNTCFRGISFENVEVDFARPCWKGHIQKTTEDTAFPRVRSAARELFCVNVSNYGRYLGNQKFEPAHDLTGFHVRYEDIAFRNFRVLGDVPSLSARVDDSTAPHELTGLVVEGMPPLLGDGRLRKHK